MVLYPSPHSEWKKRQIENRTLNIPLSPRMISNYHWFFQQCEELRKAVTASIKLILSLRGSRSHQMSSHELHTPEQHHDIQCPFSVEKAAHFVICRVDIKSDPANMTDKLCKFTFSVKEAIQLYKIFPETIDWLVGLTILFSIHIKVKCLCAWVPVDTKRILLSASEEETSLQVGTEEEFFFLRRHQSAGTVLWLQIRYWTAGDTS